MSLLQSKCTAVQSLQPHLFYSFNVSDKPATEAAKKPVSQMTTQEVASAKFVPHPLCLPCSVLNYVQRGLE